MKQHVYTCDWCATEVRQLQAKFYETLKTWQQIDFFVKQPDLVAGDQRFAVINKLACPKCWKVIGKTMKAEIKVQA